MLKKKLTALFAALMTAIALISVTRTFGAETTNLKLEHEALQLIEMPAGATIHMEVELSVIVQKLILQFQIAHQHSLVKVHSMVLE